MAAGDQLLVEGTPITWSDATTGGDEVIDLGTANGGSDAVCVGAYHDFGTFPNPILYLVELFIDGFDASPSAGEIVDCYLCGSRDASLWTGPEAPADTSSGAGTKAKLANLTHAVSCKVWSGTAGDNIVKGEMVLFPYRYVAPVVHNQSAQALLTTSDAHKVILTPYYWQIEQ